MFLCFLASCDLSPMMYVIAWAVFLLLCVVALPIAVVMENKRAAAAASGYDETRYGDEAYAEPDEGDVEPMSEGDAFDDQQADFPAEEMPDTSEPVADDFSAFDEEFK